MPPVATYLLARQEIRDVNERQHGVLLRHLDDLRHVVRLSIVVLAGVLAVLGLVRQAGVVLPAYVAVVMAVALVVLLGAAIQAVHSAAGWREHEIPLGPDPETVLARLDVWTDESLLVAAAHAAAQRFIRTSALMRTLSGRLRHATRFLIAGTCIAALAMALIVAEAI